MYINVNQVPVFGVAEKGLLSQRDLETQTSSSVGVTDAQRQLARQWCGGAKKWLTDHPTAADFLVSSECGICPVAPDCPVADCPAAPGCPDLSDYVLKSDVSSGGIKWWWLLVAAAGGIAAGAAGASVFAKKSP